MENNKNIKRENNEILIQHKTEVQKSSVHGLGVFAKEDIKQGEVIEECHFMSLSPPMYNRIKRWPIIRYVFHYPKGLEGEELAWPFGNGCIYNSSSNPNADWNTDINNRLFVFIAIKDIKKGEEIYTNYEQSIKWCKQQNLI
jgi:hypothetical protein